MSNPLYDALFADHLESEAVFLHHPDGTQTTYADFIGQAAQYANALIGLGVNPGDRVAVHVAKSPQALALYAACVRAGIVFLPLNTAYTATELTYFIEDSGAALFVCDTAEAETMQPLVQRIGCRLETLGPDNGGSLADLVAGQDTRFQTVDRDGDDLAAFLYTSGTTGRSKGAMLTQTNLLSNARALVTAWQFTKNDVLLHALPIFHSHGLFVATNVMLLAGGAMIFLPKFDTDTVLGFLPRATSMMGVPTFYTRLLDDPRFDRDLVAHMRLFISGSAPLLAETHRVFEERTGHRILERYGMTETSMNTSNPLEGERRAGTVGFPLPGIEIKITDPETGEIVPQGEIGVLEVRGPNVFKGYWNMPEKTAEELRADGFFITGDLASLDEDGYIQIVGRNKDLIISGGYNIYPKEIELFLDAQNGVSESAVIGVPHPDFGETVVAVLVAEADSTLLIPEIEQAANVALAGFKRPRRYQIVASLPRNTMGKVQKNILRDEYKNSFMPE